MPKVTITSKGQVTLPKNVREKLNLRSGDKISIELTDSGEAKIQPAKFSIM